MEQFPPQKLYRQEGSVVPFTSWGWVLAIANPDNEAFPIPYTTLATYFHEDYGMGYWDYQNLHNVAESVYKKYATPAEFATLFQKYRVPAESLQKLYFSTSTVEDIDSLSQQVWTLYTQFWRYSFFIDSFDGGFDQEETQRLAKHYSFSTEELGILTTPVQPTYTMERQLALLTLAKEPDSEGIQHYIQQYGYYKSNYAYVHQLNFQEVEEEMCVYKADPGRLAEEYEQLKNYSENQEKKMQKVLADHGLDENPLYFFNQLTSWREDRKKVNLMGIHILWLVLAAIEQKTGIPHTYLQYLSYEEVEAVLKGLVSKNVLQKRREQGVVVSCAQDGYQILEGPEAQSLANELEAIWKGEEKQGMDLKGNVASQGYAKGIACIVMDHHDFSSFQEGNILVTGMTRPEFLPLMKKAAGIITNEGGITCHAAIVSRELGKPCIIGTKNATEVIKNGDLVEVRANHGTVRILR